jgi:hypothetical protein
MSKLVVALVLCGLLVAPVAFAQTNVLSQNAVGYVKITVPGNNGTKNGLALVRHDFVNIDGSALEITEVLGDNWPNNTTLHIWDRANQEYKSTIALTVIPFVITQWSGTATLDVGDAFWIENFDTNPAENYLLGEVPADASRTIDPAVGYIGYPFPAAVEFTTTAIADAMPNNAALTTWNLTTQAYNPSIAKTLIPFVLTTWSGTAMIEPGEGFYIDTAGATPTVAEPKPYLWP